ncbi:MAG: LysM peptidoglycan-binding domain-containing protein [Bacteroidota bacterium]
MTRIACFLLLLLAMPLAASAQAPRVHVVKPGETLYRIATTNGMTVDELKALNGLVSNTIQVGQRLRLPGEEAPPADPPPPDPIPTDPAPADPPPPARPEPRPPDVDPVPPPPSSDTPLRPVPGERPPREAPSREGTQHIVQSGETLFRIALRYDTTVEALRQLNGIQGDQIAVGQVLVVTQGGGRPQESGRAAPIARSREWSITNTTVPADLVHFVEPGETLYSIAAQHGISVDALVSGNAVTTAPLEPGTMLVLPEPIDPGEAQRDRLPPVLADGLALVFPDVLQGRPTASGEPYDPLDFTASHRDLPFGTVLLISNPANNRTTFVRVTDRGPVSQAYLMEISAAAATALDLDPNAALRVEVRALP